MVAPDEFRHKVLDGLYKDAQKGRGTDLEVIVPNDSGSDKSDGNGKAATTSFHLHHTIVAATSRYFDTFPEPKIGRLINDVDSESFSICVKFMYMGEYREAFTHENIASIPYAAELLQVDGLKRNCMEYLEHNLDHSNYEQVVELADRFNYPDLKKSALRFQSEDSSRDELLTKREALVKKIGMVKYDEKQNSDRRRALQQQLEDMEKQIQGIFQTQHEQMLSSRWENDASSDSMPAASLPFSLGTFRKPGAVGHLAYPTEEYEGSTTYGDEEDDEEFLPPPPTEEQYESYGIVNSHGSILTAIEAAKSGDRIYLVEGIHEIPDDENPYGIDKALEFIGLDKDDEVVVDVCGDKNGFIVRNGPVGFYNIKFHDRRGEEWFGSSRDKPNTSQGSGDEAVICFEGDENDEFIVKNCVFDLGSDCETAYPTRVSGIFLKKGKSAIIEGCKFVGGSGSAIVAVNDPYLYTPDIKICNNTFINNGQPTFSEKSANETFSMGSKKLEFVSIPSQEIIPGPASVEFWRFNRECYGSARAGTKEKHETITIKMTENKFEFNLRAPLAYRAIFPRSETLASLYDYSGNQTKRTRNDWQLHCGLPAGDGLKALVQGFDLTLTDNVLQNNGIQFDKETISRMKCTLAKKICKEGNAQSKRSCTFPDGDSILAIQHVITQFDKNSFPHSWGEGEPHYAYRSDHFNDGY